MKLNKKIFICAIVALMVLVCMGAVSAEEPLNETLEASPIDAVSDDALSASGDTLVVDANGGGQYTSISAAVSAATGGETIFVKNGQYTEAQPVSIGKSLSIVGESRENVIISGGSNGVFTNPIEDLTLDITLKDLTAPTLRDLMAVSRSSASTKAPREVLSSTTPRLHLARESRLIMW